jgi:hypothetical protein
MSRFLVTELGRKMSEISQECFCANWLFGQHDDLPRLCYKADSTNRDQEYGHGTLSIARARELIDLATRAGSWAVPGDDDSYEPYHPQLEFDK